MMQVVKLDAIKDGDVLAQDLYVENVYLFGAGTVLTKNRRDILRELSVESVAVEDRIKRYRSVKEVFENIEKRFSYVADNPLMQHLKYWIKDIVANTEKPS